MDQKSASRWKYYFTIIYFVISTLSLFSLLFIFRMLRIKLFFLGISTIYCTYILIKKRQFIFSKRTKSEIAIALGIDSICFFDFYFNAIHIRPGIVVTLLRKLSLNNILDENVLFALIGIIISLVGFYGATLLAPYLLRFFKELYRIIKTYKIQLVLLFLVYTVAFISVIRANYYYTDDLGRAIYGYEITGDFSRYVANILSEIFHGNTWLADISPLPQIMALFIMTLTGVILLSVLSSLLNTNAGKWSFIALIPVGLSPYFLSCLSYKYDAPYMAFSVFASVFPLIFYKYDNIKIYSVSVFIGTIVMCTTYQVSSGIFPMIVSILALIMWIQKKSYKKIGSFLLNSAISYILALLVFRLILMEPITDDNYVDVGISITNLLPNTIKYIKFFYNDFPTIWIILICIVFLSFIILLIKYAKQNKILSAVLSIIICFCAFVMSFGIYIIFNAPLTEPRAFYGIGIFLSIMCCILFLNCGCYIGKLSTISLCCFFIIYTFLYGNALNIQKNYIDFRTEQVINGCNNLGLFKESKKTKFQATGTAGYQRAVKNMIQEYPLLERQIKVLLSDSTNWSWGTYQLREYYGLNTEITDISNLQIKDDDIIKDTYYYTIYKVNDIIILNLKDVESKIQ